jgi:hypothetical protein
MHDIWRKMQVKDQRRFLVLGAPEEFQPVLQDRDPDWEMETREAIGPVDSGGAAGGGAIAPGGGAPASAPSSVGPSATPGAGTALDNAAATPRGAAPTYDVVVIFVSEPEHISRAAEVIRTNVAGDNTLLWICYPKKSSKKYKSPITRDVGWDPVIDLGWEGVRQIAIDDDWSALRFRPREAIKNYTRKSTIGKGA